MAELSVVVPTFNRAQSARRLLESLAGQSLAPNRHEVVVVDDGSTDGTQAVLAGLRPPYTLRVLRQANRGQGAARNRGAGEARGRICLFLDDELTADLDLLARHLEAHAAEGETVAMGRVDVSAPPRADAFVRYFVRWYAEHNERLRRGERPPTYTDCHSGNVFVPAERFLRAGGFAEDLPASLDFELGYRLEREGLRLVFLPDAVARQTYNKTGGDLAAIDEAQGAEALELHRRHPPIAERIMLGAFFGGSGRKMLLGGLLLSLRVPARLLIARGSPLGPEAGDRWYRFVYQYCHWRGVRRAASRDLWPRLARGAPILLYHAFADGREPPSRYVVPARRLARQLALLRLLGYRVIGLAELAEHLRAHRFPPPRSVALTIDDGYRDVGAVAAPLLRRHAAPATVFLVSAAVADANAWDGAGPLAGRPLLSWEEVAELPGVIEIGARTRTHPRLGELPEERAREEIAGSRRELRERLGRPVASFAYPYGKEGERERALAAEAGFAAACGTEEGMNTAATPLLALSRVEVRGTDSLFRFALKLWLGESGLVRRRAEG